MSNFETNLIAKLNLIENNLPTDFKADSTAAVMILFVNMDGRWNIIYTRRTKGLKTHQGEVSFPGGSYEPQDNSLAQTAFRETMEEIGISASCIKLLGGLEPYETIHGLLVYPFVGILQCKMDFVMNPEEVARIFTIPVEWLNERKNYYEKEYIINGKQLRHVLHYKDYDGEHLWGFTARITKDILG